MQTVLLFTISVLPAIVLLWYFKKQNKGPKESKRLEWKIFAWGLMAAIFAIVIEVSIEILFSRFGIRPVRNFWLFITLTSFITAAFVEEALKFWVVKTHAYDNKSFNEVMDGITYTIIASLGFATFENILYVMNGGLAIGITRALITVPAHAMFSGIMGFYIGKAKFAKNPSQSKLLMLKGFGYGVLYHGLFDFFIFTQSALMALIIPLMVIMGAQLKNLMGQADFQDHVTKIKVKPVTVGGYIRLAIGISLMIFAAVDAVCVVILYLNDTSETEVGEMIGAMIGAMIILLLIFGLGYRIFRRPHPQSSHEKTT